MPSRWGHPSPALPPSGDRCLWGPPPWLPLCGSLVGAPPPTSMCLSSPAPDCGSAPSFPVLWNLRFEHPDSQHQPSAPAQLWTCWPAPFPPAPPHLSSLLPSLPRVCRSLPTQAHRSPAPPPRPRTVSASLIMNSEHETVEGDLSPAGEAAVCGRTLDDDDTFWIEMFLLKMTWGGGLGI